MTATDTRRRDETATGNDRPAWGRGVLASYAAVTPPGRRLSDADRKFTLTFRDALALLVGCLGMFALQLGAQYGLRSDIRDLKTTFESYQQKQNETNSMLQRQIDEWRVETKLNRERDGDRQREVAEVKGLLTGIGILKEQKK